MGGIGMMHYVHKLYKAMKGTLCQVDVKRNKRLQKYITVEGIKVYTGHNYIKTGVHST